MMVVSNHDDGITIEDGMKYVTEIEGSVVGTGRKIRFRVNEYRVDNHYFIHPITHEKLIVQKRQVGSNRKNTFFVADPEDSSKNLLIKLEKKLVSSPDS